MDGMTKTVRLRRSEAVYRKSCRIVDARSGGCCEVLIPGVVCQVDYGLQHHHRQAKGMGGSADVAVHSPANLLHCCRPAHDWIHAHPAEAKEAGWIVSRPANPAGVPVLWRRRWVLLDADGGVSRAYTAGVEAEITPLSPALADGGYRP